MQPVNDFSNTGRQQSDPRPGLSPEKDANAHISATLKPYRENASTPAFNDVKQALLWAWDGKSVQPLDSAGNQLITALESAQAEYSRHCTGTEAGTIFKEVAKKQLVMLLPKDAEQAYMDLVGANAYGSRGECDARIVSGLQRLAEKGIQGSAQSAMPSSATLDTRAVAKVDTSSNASRAKSADASDIEDMTNDTDATLLESQVAEALKSITKDNQGVIGGLFYMWHGNVNEEAKNTFKAIEQGKEKYVNAMKGVIAERGDQSARQFNTEMRRQLAEKLPSHLREKYKAALTQNEADLKQNRIDYQKFLSNMRVVMIKLSPEGVTCAVRAARGNTEKSGNSGVSLLWSKAVQKFEALTTTEKERMSKPVTATEKERMGKPVTTTEVKLMSEPVTTTEVNLMSEPVTTTELERMSKSMTVLIDKLLEDRPEWQARPEVKELRQSMQAYIKSFDAFFGPRQRLLLEKHPESIIKAAMSVKCISSLPEKDAIAIATQRELLNLKMVTLPAHVNKAALGCEISAMRSIEFASKPGNQLSIAMEVPIITDTDRMCTATVMSVAAPALDMHTQPEWKKYVKKGKLEQEDYEKSMKTLRNHVAHVADIFEYKTVALSAYGLNNFLKGFGKDEEQKNLCTEIGKAELGNLIFALQDEYLDVRYMDISEGKIRSGMHLWKNIPSFPTPARFPATGLRQPKSSSLSTPGTATP
ncbi:MAG TPA: hypothetical protein VF797_01140 [Noviherbaspirillum sp.]